jgi:hypothetical protein
MRVGLLFSDFARLVWFYCEFMLFLSLGKKKFFMSGFIMKGIRKYLPGAYSMPALF